MAAECVFRAYYCPVAAGSVAAPPALHIHVQEKKQVGSCGKKTTIFIYIFITFSAQTTKEG